MLMMKSPRQSARMLRSFKTEETLFLYRILVRAPGLGHLFEGVVGSLVVESDHPHLAKAALADDHMEFEVVTGEG